MSNEEGYWTLGIQVNRKIGDKVHSSLRIYVPTNDDTEILLKRVQAEGGEDAKLYFSAKINGSTITLRQVQPQTRPKASRPSLSERADQIIGIIAQLGGTTTWPTVREKLGLPSESTPSPFLVKQLRDRGLQTTKNPKTSTMTWQLMDREKLNGWTNRPVSS
jgi:hypothetical protein